MRALIVVMDSVGIGGAPDAAAYGDEGADTIGHIAEACAIGDADNEMRQGPLHLPHLVELGLGNFSALCHVLKFTGQRDAIRGNFLRWPAM